ncbi:MAG TPA: conjugal transfer protein TraF [Thermodesulfobacteriota bacterium]
MHRTPDRWAGRWPLAPAAALAAALGLAAAAPAAAVEFQPLGTLGMGGAGVARPPDGLAPYWNPAALAFNRRVAARLGAGVGAAAHDDIVDDLDRLSRIDVEAIADFTGSPATDRGVAADAVQMLALLRKIDRSEGALSVRANALAGLHVRRLGFGVYGTGEAALLPDIDTTNVLPEAGGAPIDAAAMSALGVGAPPSNAFFSPAQRAEIEAALAAAGVANPADVVSAFDAELDGSNEAGVTPAEATDALVALAEALGSGGPIDANASVLRNRGIGLVEVPLSYGHPIRLGRLGSLGLGASVKLMRGRVYVSEIEVFGTDAGEALDELRESYRDSTAFGLDLGAVWWPNRTIGVGVVGKHLNGPRFEAPIGPDLEVDPQVRAGVSWAPLRWLSLAADIDLTENETALAGVRSRILGGGVELAPFQWFRLRGGAYTNLAESGSSPVLTAGLAVGVPWLTVDVEGAVAVDRTTYDGREYPEEGRLNAGVTLRF